MASIAINGLGRIGRAALKIIEQADGAEVVAVNDLILPDNLAYLLRYDTVYGRWHTTVTADGDALAVGGRKIPVLARRDPAELPWRDLGVDLVLECTGAFRREEDLKKHLAAGARRVILSAPARTETIATVVHGVNRAPAEGAGDLLRELHHQLHHPGRRGAGPPVRHPAGDHDHRPRLHLLPAAHRRARQGLPARPGRRGEHAPGLHRRRARHHQGAARPGREVRRGRDPGADPGRVHRRRHSRHRPPRYPRGGQRRLPGGGGQRPLPRHPRGRRRPGRLRRHHRRPAGLGGGRGDDPGGGPEPWSRS